MDGSAYRKLRSAISESIWEQLDPLEGEIEDTGKLPMDKLFPLLRQSGAFGLLIPEEYGGSGLTIEQYLPIIAEFAQIHGGIRVLVHVHNSFAHALSEIGSKPQREEILPLATVGKRSVAFALTEPDRGTGADLGTTAVREEGRYLINGRKWLITNSGHRLAFHGLRQDPSNISVGVARGTRQSWPRD